MNCKKSVVSVAVFLIFGAAIVAGCGGSIPQTVSGETGTLRMSFASPTEDRYIPPATKSFKIMVQPEGNLTTIQASAWVNGSGETVLSNIPAGPYDVRVWAYNGMGATGNVIAWGICQVMILGGRDNEAHVNLKSDRLVFTSWRDGGNRPVIYRATPDGFYTSRVTSADGFSGWPAPSPDGRKIAFGSGIASSTQIRIYDCATSSITLFSDLVGGDYDPEFSPDSNTVVWVNSNAGTYTLRKKNLDGSGSGSYSFGTSTIGDPTFSPDGTRIAVHMYDGVDWEIAIVQSDFSGSHWLATNDSISEMHPCWSQEDDHVIYCSASDANGHLQVAYLNADFYPGNTATPYLLTHEQRDHKYVTAASPDGRELAYTGVGENGEYADIYYLNVDSGISTRVTYNSAWDGDAKFLRPTTGSTTVVVD
ncbi:MAG: hypothetical protein COX39_01980 [Candidatus Nealsonbacteria bacterium CG23_combo_of_CG06-09_8_20_14_all_40_13]|uniref:Fibronectin type-III domain-containing protein n=1 Tax=Candidatus Nealsonbacteria bacterium CG23_combo_of_CG06-09_8_20_14_all_40_13 TaxID=1974724 RepID=A0A2G9YQT2_9BACT|nr:MAG: hypothetical protein COX39_01980 [Candidatus Nealsonbacteria bacterium CG23_combo_of_CG06-09_8_20_14_all_40_13]PIR71338.1 MAG: hypothetical protein COU44_00170 [Candidatus Nealsonbacteria bacterium CG10_big_fil_rev_8_21_14_0_10_40_24]PIU43059.1 MAG: hypothetical protein COS97_03060 [Candidatus Nealsonbacteria bacterium CG07_land_8_20_14_0_80_40_10]